MPPYAARDLYQRQVEAQPERADLRVGYGSVLRFLGYHDDAARQYRTAVQFDPDNTEAYLNLGLLAREAGDRTEARRMFQRVVETVPRSELSRQQREEYLRCTQEELDELDGALESRGPRRAVAPPEYRPSALAPARSLRTVAPPFGKVGRNEPCPCGSGKKYKKCCGR